MGKKCYIGIDPGATGALAIIFEDGKIEVFDYPGDERELMAQMKRYAVQLDPISVVIEVQQSMPLQGVVSAFKLGGNYYSWLTAIAAVDWPVTLVRPAEWKSNMGYPAKVAGQNATARKKVSKAYSVTMARRLYPHAGEFLTLVKHHDRAEAILLAHYAGRRSDKWLE